MRHRLWSRRAVLAASALSPAVLAMRGGPAMAETDLRGLAEEAAIWGFPLVFFGLYFDAAAAGH